MCKILIIPNASKLNKNKLNDLIKAVKKPMTEVDKDGFGYAALGKKGIFGAKTLDPRRFDPAEKIKTASFSKVSHAFFGEQTDLEGGLLVHSRMSTNTISLDATHPFLEQGQCLIHNGVTRNIGETVEFPSGNDSEMLFKHWLKGGMDRVASSVSGYYALGILNQNTKQTHVIKDSTAKLAHYWSDFLESWVFATNDLILKTVQKYLKEKSAVLDVLDNVHLCFNASGRLIFQKTFTPVEESFGHLDSKSLGFTYPVEDYDRYTPAYREDLTGIVDKNGKELTISDYAKLSKEEREECLEKIGPGLKFGA